MSLEAAKCPSCDANIEVPIDRETVYCAYCGSAIKSKAAIAYGKTVTIEGEVKVEGIATLEKLVQNAETYMQLNEYSKAKQTYEQIVKDYPEDYRGWLGLFLLQIRTASFAKIKDFDDSEKHYLNACNVIKSDVIKKQVEEIYETEWQTFLDKISNAIFDINYIQTFFLIFLKMPELFTEENSSNSFYSDGKWSIVSHIDVQKIYMLNVNKYLKKFLTEMIDIKVNLDRHMLHREKNINNSNYIFSENYFEYMKYKLIFRHGKLLIWSTHESNYRFLSYPIIDIINIPINKFNIFVERISKGLCPECGGEYNILKKCKSCGYKK